jgi:hypothetical protein
MRQRQSSDKLTERNREKERHIDVLYRDREKQTRRQTDTHTDRQTDRLSA